MNHLNQLTILVVCSGPRGEEIASSLIGCDVLLRSFCKPAKAWKLYRWNPDKKQLVESAESALFSEIDVLFFHKSDGDPNGIPNNIRFAREFVFSGAGVGHNENPTNRNAIPIQRHILKGSRLIKPRHIRELVDFVGGSRVAIPSFCRPEVTLSGLFAIAITCQAYSAAGVANGVIRPGNSLYDAMGWDKLSVAALERISSSFENMWPRMQEPQWWMNALGVSGSEDLVLQARFSFLVQLAKDLDLPSASESTSSPIKERIQQAESILAAHSENAELLASFLRFENPAQLAPEVFSSVSELLAQQ